jgi:hypothetical protein
MKPWHIEWTQTTDGKEKHFTSGFIADTPHEAIAQWEAKSYCNARIDAVYDPQKFESKRLGETVAAPPAGTGKLPPVGEEVKEDWLDMPRGVKLQRFVAADRAVTFMGQYVNREGTPNDAPCRLYRIEVRPQLIEGGWCVAIFEDNKRVWSAKANTSRYCAEYTAVKMLKCLFKYKLRNCDKRRRQRDSKRSRKAVAV